MKIYCHLLQFSSRLSLFLVFDFCVFGLSFSFVCVIFVVVFFYIYICEFV